MQDGGNTSCGQSTVVSGSWWNRKKGVMIRRVEPPITSCGTCPPRPRPHLREELAEDYRRMIYAPNARRWSGLNGVQIAELLIG
jgi:hypothetical protein